jgi:hypothetical protein
MIKGSGWIGHASTRHVPHGSSAALHFYRNPGELEDQSDPAKGEKERLFSTSSFL